MDFSIITPLDKGAMTQCQQRWDSIAKPLSGLGWLEDALMTVAGIQGTAQVTLSPRAVLVLCADNGIVAQQVTQAPQEVTSVVTENMSLGRTSVCAMAKVAQAEVIPVNIGCGRPVHGERILQRVVARGTADFSQEPAMTLAQVEEGIQVGIDLVRDCKKQGYKILATGEMGIGNTTTASAVTSVLLGKDPSQVTGRGAGLSTEGLLRKQQVIRDGIALHQPNPKDVVEVLSKVGGLDIAGLCGVFLGGGLYNIPIIIDGFISSVGAYCATQLCSQVRDYMLPSHCSGEPAGQLVLEAMGLRPLVYGGFSLGEGTGAVTLFPLLDMALSVYEGMCSFHQTQLAPYEKWTEETI